VSNRIDTKKIKLGKTNPPSKLQKGALSQVVKCEPGRPRLKRPQRKKPPMPRQVSSPAKAKMLKVAAILRRGELFPHAHV